MGIGLRIWSRKEKKRERAQLGKGASAPRAEPVLRLWSYSKMSHRELFHTDATQAFPDTVFIKRVLIADGNTGYKNVDVTISDGKITAVAEDGHGVCPAGATILDGFDKLLVPGRQLVLVPLGHPAPTRPQTRCSA